MGAYICGVCDNMFDSHEVNFYHCEKCNMDFCESCWQERQAEGQDDTDEVCGKCYEKGERGFTSEQETYIKMAEREQEKEKDAKVE